MARSPEANPLNPIDPLRVEVGAAFPLLQAGSAVLLDARSPGMYENAHPQGALSLPAALLEGPTDAGAIAVANHPGLLLFYCA